MAALVADSGRKTPAHLAGSAILSCQSDERLVRLVRSGHERAFEAIVQRYRAALVRYCRRILPESRCEDAVQQALLNAHGALLASDDAVQLKPWLFAITRNAALNMLRQNGWNYEQIPGDFDGVPQPDQVFEQRAQLERTVEALNDLPERQRDALVMREFEGRSYDEIALALGANDGAVRQLLNRARVTLRNAAAALIPPPFVMRAAAAMPPGDGRRAAEILGGLGAAGVAKASATVLVAGTLVVGAVEAPLSIDGPKRTTRESATLGVAKPHGAKLATAAATQRRPTPAALLSGQPTGASHHSRGGSLSGRGEHSGSSHSGPGSGGSDDGASGETHSGSGEGEHSGARGGSGSDGGVTSGGSDGRSGRTEADSTRTRSGSGSSGSGSSGSGSSGSGSGDSGSTTTAITSPTSGSSGSGSGSTSGGSGSSGSGSSGSGSSAPSGSGSSGSSGSGSGSSGSGDLLQH